MVGLLVIKMYKLQWSEATPSIPSILGHLCVKKKKTISFFEYHIWKKSGSAPWQIRMSSGHPVVEGGCKLSSTDRAKAGYMSDIWYLIGISDMDIRYGYLIWMSDIDIWDDGLVRLTVVSSSEIAMLNRSDGPRHLVPEFVALILIPKNRSW